MKGARKKIKEQKAREEENPEGYQVGVPKEVDGTNSRKRKAATASGCTIPVVLVMLALLLTIIVTTLIL